MNWDQNVNYVQDYFLLLNGDLENLNNSYFH